MWCNKFQAAIFTADTIPTPAAILTYCETIQLETMCENIGRPRDDAQIVKFPCQYSETTQDLLSDLPNYSYFGSRNLLKFFIPQNFPMYSKCDRILENRPFRHKN